MDFMRECARRLDAGASAESVLADMRARYTTPGCLNVKTCAVRKLCAPTAEYEAACAARVRAFAEECGGQEEAAAGVEEGGDDEDEARRKRIARFEADLRAGTSRDAATRKVLYALPPRLPANVRRLTITRAEVRACKRAHASRAVARNRVRQRVDGRALLAHSRATVAAAARAWAERAATDESASVASLALALMLATGRRSCEVLNGRSTVAAVGPYAVRFGGQAKRRGVAPDAVGGVGDDGGDGKGVLGVDGSDGGYVVPVLAPADDVVGALAALRRAQRHAVLGNRETSRRYQSLLGRTLAADATWKECGRPHALRGVYACVALRLFDWGDAADAYVAMCILGHSGLTESLVYTPYHLGDDFGAEPRLGAGSLTDVAPTQLSHADGTPSGGVGCAPSA